MTTISLRDYLEHINSLIENGNNQEAIFHCTNILKSYPKCVEVYRLLGKSLLSHGDHAEALDVFSKVLSVIPDDPQSHAGLSKAYEFNQQLDKAIWHMERSFESEPSNLIAQEELKRLFSARDGVPPAKIRLTRGALIRMYAKGELHQQAIAEAQSVLEGDSERNDIRLLLAKTYQASGALVEAEETCSLILKELPYCFEANRIMHEIESSNGENGESSLFTSRIIEIDPYYGFVNDTQPSATDVPSDAIILDKPDYIDTVSDEEIPVWARQIGLTLPGVAESMPAEQPEIAEETSIAAVIESKVVENIDVISPLPVTSENVQAEIQEPLEDELPDWIAKAGWIRANEDETPPSAEEVPPTESVIEEPELAAPAEDLPDWLKSLTPIQPPSEEVDAVNGRMPDFDESDLEEIASISTGEIDEILGKDGNLQFEVESEHGVLDELVPEESFTLMESSSSENVEPPELPDWLSGLEIDELVPPLPVQTPSEWVTIDNEVNAEADSPLIEAKEGAAEQVNMSMDIPPAAESVEFELTAEAPPVPLEITENVPLASESTLEDLMAELGEDLPEPPVLITDAQVPPVESMVKPMRPEVPFWVQKILGSSEAAAPAVASAKMFDTSQPPEIIEPLITDLPGEHPDEGAISEDVNLELMTWLTDINPDDAMEEKQLSVVSDQTEEPVNLTEQVSPIVTPELAVESTDISLDALSDTTLVSEMDLLQESLPTSEEERTAKLEEIAPIEYEDRLSSLMDQESLPPQGAIPPIESAIPIIKPLIETEESFSADDTLIQLLAEKKYKELGEHLTESTLSKDMLQAVNERARSMATDEPDSFELWKTIGDIELKKTDISQALEAYKKAEQIIFQ